MNVTNRTHKKTAGIVSLTTPIGKITAGFSDNALLCIHIGEKSEENVQFTLLQLVFQIHDIENHLSKTLKKEIVEYFEGIRKRFSVKMDLFGTPFQKKIWQELMKVPYGSVVTYGQLAEQAGFPKAARAVGMAMGRNRIPILIPCHRVIASNGKLGGFGCGIEIKKKLLRLENAI